MSKVEFLGGTVLSTWSDQVTHLIIESTFTAKPVLMYLSLTRCRAKTSGVMI